MPPSGTSQAATPLPPVVRQLGWISFLTDAATEMLYPILPLFLTITLGAPVAAIGLIEGLADGAANGLKAAAGYVTDRVNTLKPLVYAGYATSAFAKPLLAFAPGWGVVLVLRVSDRFGKAFRGVPRDLMLAEAVPAEVRGRAFGLHRAMDSAGAVVGPLIGLGALLWLGERHLRTVFLLAFVPASFTLLLLAKLPRGERPPRPDVSPAADAPSVKLPWRSPFGRYVLALALFGLGNSSDAFLLLRAKDLGLSATAVVLAYALFNLADTLVARPAGALGDRIGRMKVFRGGLACFALVYLGFAVAPRAWWVWPLMVVYGAYKGLTDGASRAVVFDLVPDRDIRGRALGTSQAVNGVCVLVSSLVAGVLYQAVSPAAPFVVGAVAGALAFAVLLGRDR
jgi:MFS family permease